MSTGSFVGAACVGCNYGIGGVCPGDGGPPVDDDGHALTFFRGEWRCRLCMDDVREWTRMECEAATARGYALMRRPAAFLPSPPTDSPSEGVQ